jgi:2-polyprenyl-3-methyl-5-hydroxy-6-metoxy-1,4-benzoquinol methylase
MAIITYTTCPCCGSAAIHSKLNAADFTVSHETFGIWECGACSMRFTQSIPAAPDIGDYYRSDTYISHTDTKKGIINRLYHFVRKRTLKRKRRLVQQITGLQTGRLMDIGAGTGAFSYTMQQAGWQVSGLEPDAATRQRAVDLHGIQLQSTDALFQSVPESFDAITLWHVLEHVHELHAYIEQIKKLLRKDGKALIAVPNYTSYDAKVYLQFWAAYDVPRHLYHFSPAAMEKLLQQHGLKLAGTKPMWYDSFYIAMLSEKYKNGHGNLLKAVWTGFISNLVTLFNSRRCSSLIYIIGK